jgi:beta-aspartyl-peptidase (threonine type)
LKYNLAHRILSSIQAGRSFEIPHKLVNYAPNRYKYSISSLISYEFTPVLGKSAQEATEEGCINMTKRVGNTAGAITLSNKGDVGISFTSKRMAWAYRVRDELHYGCEPGEHIIEKC